MGLNFARLLRQSDLIIERRADSRRPPIVTCEPPPAEPVSRAPITSVTCPATSLLALLGALALSATAQDDLLLSAPEETERV